MNVKNTILETIKKRPMFIDGAMGTQLQEADIPKEAWINDDLEGCNELLNATAPEILEGIYSKYLTAGADLITTNTFGSFDWVLDEYQIGDRAYELSKLGAEIVKKMCDKFSTPEHPRFVLGALGPGTKLPSLGHMHYDEMYAGYVVAATGLIDGGVDVFLLETCQDPLQVKAALHACQEACRQKEVEIPIMISITIELAGTMLIGTDAQTAAAIFEPFDVLSLGFNCGTGPEQYTKHVKTLSEVWDRPISVHANAGLPQNRGGYTFYPMGPDDFAKQQEGFLAFDGVSFLGGCCGTTPQHIRALVDRVSAIAPKPASGSQESCLASLFHTVPLMQEPAPLLVGERSNATGSKAFRELLIAEDYEGTLTVGQQQVRAGAHVIDVSVGFAGRDEKIDKLKGFMEAVRTEVHVVEAQNWIEPLKGILKKREIKTLLYAPQTTIGDTLQKHWPGEDENDGLPELVTYEGHIENFKDQLFHTDAAITSTLGGIAETGAIILWPDKKEPRSMSLVPPVHIAVLDADKIFNTLGEVMQAQNWPEKMPTNAVLISGPSKTADIELILAFGVHGPKELIVFILS